MGKLLIVRHGQANFGGQEYDQLSPMGIRQAQQLGLFWLSQGRRFDQVLLGPKRRHQQTWTAVAKVYQSQGISLPEPRILADLDEHHGAKVVFRTMEERGQLLNQENHRERVVAYFKAYQEITQEWVSGALSFPEIESWSSFRQRVVAVLAQARIYSGTTALFTSAGPLAIISGHALGLDEQGMLGLSWVVRNSAFSECLHSGPRLSLLSFNELGHLAAPDLHTFI